MEEKWIKKKYVGEVYLPVSYVEKLDEVLSLVISVVKDDATKIVLFGSSATGALVCGSDLDILVIIPACKTQEERRTLSLAIEVADVRNDVGDIPVDVVVRRQDFLDAEGVFQRDIREQAIVLWERG